MTNMPTRRGERYHHDQVDAVRRCARGVFKAADQPTCRRCQETP